MKKLTLILMLTLGLTLTACGASAKFPTGKFVSPDNKSYWQFNPDGTWSFRDRSGVPIDGTYTTDGSTYTDTYSDYMFADDANCAKQATYTWSYSNSQLTFKTTTDKCAVRQAWYTSAVFVLSQ